MRIFFLECKKQLMSKVNMIVLIVFCIMSVMLFQSEVEREVTGATYIDEAGNDMPLEMILEIQAKAKKPWEGEMNEEWHQRLEKAYTIAERKWDERLYDFTKMNAAYGEEWYSEYIENPKTFVSEDEKDKEGKRILYTNAERELGFTKEDIENLVILDLYDNYGKTMLVKKPWNSKDGTYGVMYNGYNGESTPNPVYSISVKTQVELDFLRKEMNSKGYFHYGDSKQWDSIMTTTHFLGIMLLIWIILLSSNCINRERRGGMIEILSSCTKGKQTLFIAKLSAVIMCGLLGFVILVGTLLIYASALGYLGDTQVNITEGIYSISVFTYGEGFMISSLMLVIGVISVSTFCCVLSTYIKSSYTSFMIAFVLMCLPVFVDIPYHNVLPVGYMQVENVAVRGFTIAIASTPFYVWKVILCVWIPISILCSIIAYKKFTSKSYQRCM